MIKIKDGYKDSEVGVIPVEWDVSKLGKIANITKLAGYEFTEYFDYEAGGEIIALRALNVVNGKLNLNSIQRVSEEISNKLPRSKLYIDDMLMTYVGTLGQFAIIEENDKFHLAPNVAKITINSQDINSSKYTLAYLMSSTGQKQIKLLSTTTSQPAINMENIRKISIPLPPLKEQEKIADILSTVDDKIDAIATQIEKAQTLKKGLLQKLLSEGIGHSEFKDSELGKIPESWEVVELNNILTIQRGASPRPINEFITENEDGVNWIKIGDIKKGAKYITKTKQKITDDGAKKSRAIQPKDFVLSNSMSFGRPYISKIYGCIHDGWLLLRNKNENILSNGFLYEVLSADLAVNQFKRFAAGSTVNNLKSETVSTLKIPLPPIEEQKQIADILSTADEKLEVLRAKKEKYETLKKGLLQKLLSGELRTV